MIGKQNRVDTAFYKAASREAMLQRLHAQSIEVLEIKERSWISAFGYEYLEPQIKPHHVVELLHQIHMIVKSGLSIHEGLESLAQESKHKKMKLMMSDIAQTVSSGDKLSTVMLKYPKIFSKDVIYFIRIGEQSGSLEETLLKAKNFLERDTQLKRNIKMALIYPSMIFLVAFIAVMVWFTFVLPQLTQMFEQMEIRLPALTQLLMTLGDFFIAMTPWALAVVVIGLFLMRWRYRKSPKFRYRFWKGLSSLRLFSRWIRSYNSAYICDVLQLSMHSGISMYVALETIGKNISNAYYQEGMKNVLKSLSKGDQLSTAFELQSYAPFMVRMIKVGEKSGDLEEQLTRISDYYYEQLDYYAQTVTKLIEPAMILFIGGFFALIMVGLMGPIFDMVAKIQ